MSSDSDSGVSQDSDIDPQALKQMYSQVLKRKRNQAEQDIQFKGSIRSRSRSRDINRRGAERVSMESKEKEMEKEVKLYKYEVVPINTSNVPEKIKRLPVFKKQNQILETILKNQVVLITGETGCGKSTQIPRLLYEYLVASKVEGKILCVQPRRLAAMNLQKILSKQIPTPDVVSYQIAMANTLKASTKILFMTNGIFLQRFIHGSKQLLQQYPFIILDEVHQRDIDTDFILLAVKHVVRKNPKIRVILMSATIDNSLFQYYFSQDHITKFLNEQNLYMRCLKITQQKSPRRNESDSQDSEDMKIQQRIAMDFMKSKKPCPAIAITEQGSFKKKIYYLDNINDFLKRQIHIEWANTLFDQRYPVLSKQIIKVGAQIVQQIFHMENNSQNFTILIFLPGLAEIQQFCGLLVQYFSQKSNFDIIQLHSSTLTPQISSQLNDANPPRARLIAATNIAESSITVMGVKYILDFCMSKEVRFNHKTRLQNLQMIWSSQASSQQRAGRTGRVCDGYVIRLLQKQFYDKLPKYSTPQIQRCSLDRLILRIKLLHLNQIEQKSSDPLFSDPGMVLGRAIQPPSLRHIDASIQSLIFNGGLQLVDDQFILTDIGRLYIDLPIDIIYARMLIVSIMFGTFDDIIILVTILQQAKNPFRKQGIEKKSIDYWQLIQNQQLCDFYSIVQIYKRKILEKQRIVQGIQAFSASQLRTHKIDIEKRLMKLDIFKHRPIYKQDSQLRFKLTVWISFLDNAMRVVIPSRDQKQQKRVKDLLNKGLPVERTLVVNSTILKKNKTVENTTDFTNSWKSNIENAFRLYGDPQDIILDYWTSYIVFKNPLSAYKILFCKAFEQLYGSRYDPVKQEEMECINQKHLNFQVGGGKKLSKITSALNALGDIQFLNQGQAMDMYSNRKMTIDTLSINRIISIKDSSSNVYLVTNSKHQRNSGSYCRYTCMLPDQLGLYQILLMCFYPYLTIRTDQKHNFYDYIKLKKKTKIKVGFTMTSQDIKEMNVIRGITKKYLNLTFDQKQQKSSQLWPLLKQILNVKREPIIDQKKWQTSFLASIKHVDSYEQIQEDKLLELKYMSEIQISRLRRNYFSYQHHDRTTYKEHIKNYNNWKQKLLQELADIKDFIINTDTHVCCKQCGVKICKLKDVHPLSNFMRTFRPKPGALIQAQMNQTNDEFCGLLLSFDIHDFKVQSCPNGHVLALKFGTPEQYKFVEFSDIGIMFCNEDVQDVDFDKMDMKFYEKKSYAKLKEKNNKARQISCKVCDETFDTILAMEKHLKTWMHEEVIKQFKASLDIN